MSLEFLEAVRECAVTLEKLLAAIDEDREDIPGCINGDVLEEYLRGLNGAQETATSLLAGLLALLASAIG